MILSSLNYAGRVKTLHPLFGKLFEYVATHNLLDSELGKIVIDGERLFSFITKLKDVVETVYKYGEFTIQQKQEEMKYLQEQHQEWLKLMEEKAERDRKQLDSGNKN